MSEQVVALITAWWFISLPCIGLMCLDYAYKKEMVITWNHVVGAIIFMPGTLTLVVVAPVAIFAAWCHDKLNKPLFRAEAEEE